MLLAGGQVWFRGSVASEGLPALPIEVTGRDAAAIVSAVGQLTHAGVALRLFVGGVVRRIVGAVLLVGGVASSVRVVDTVLDATAAASRVVVDAGTASGSDVVTVGSSSAWPWVALAGAVLVAVGGTLVFARAGRWPSRQARYEPATDTQAEDTSPDAMWKAMDRGEDPTDRPGPPA